MQLIELLSWLVMLPTSTFAVQAGIDWCRYGFGHTRPPQPFGSDDLARVSTSPLLSPAACKRIISAALKDDDGWVCHSKDRYGTAAHKLPALFNIVDVVSSRPLVSCPTVYELLHKAYLPKWEPMLHGLFCDTADFSASVCGLRLKFARIVR